ncbi:6-phosphogluconolactonase [uncultured Sphaerochaeta sp.]|uniref:6-phosphogluconolactonase n=1 Tax=uncultured Sphaerochaeta sp. TaxID=886478 RepID=UPI002A0A73EF|nr:6-phosphogluconolactonase [uncultured Sphaerochaeta sp.]
MKKIYLALSDTLALLVHDDVVDIAGNQKGLIRIGLPGGRSALPLIQGILSCPQDILSRLRLYLVDERLSEDTNFNTLYKAGLEEAFNKGILKPDQLIVPKVGHPFIENEGELSLLYLGVGEDGHFASLFPGSYPCLDEPGKAEVAFVDNSPKPPAGRITVTYSGFRAKASQAKIRLLFLGEGKRMALSRLLGGREKVSTLPCSFFSLEGFSVDIVTDLKGM